MASRRDCEGITVCERNLALQLADINAYEHKQHDTSAYNFENDRVNAVCKPKPGLERRSRIGFYPRKEGWLRERPMENGRSDQKKSTVNVRQVQPVGASLVTVWWYYAQGFVEDGLFAVFVRQARAGEQIQHGRHGYHASHTGLAEGLSQQKWTSELSRC
jgi:hypothetical protein